MSDLPYRPEHVNDAIAASEELTNEELGAYIRLQRALWRAGGYLPHDMRKLARFARAGSRWGRVAPAIMGKLTAAAGLVSCPDILRATVMAGERRAKAVKAANIRHANTEVVRESSRPLKSLESTPALAATKELLAACNQNQNYLESKTLSASGDAVAVRDSKEGNSAVCETAIKLLVEKAGSRSLAARAQTARWLGACGSEAELASILEGVGRENLEGQRLIAVVNQRVNLIKQTKRFGAPLPFGFRPNVVKAKS